MAGKRVVVNHKIVSVDQIKQSLDAFIARQPRYDFGHGYLWGYIGRSKCLVAIIDGRANHTQILEEAERLGVKDPWINLD